MQFVLLAQIYMQRWRHWDCEIHLYHQEAPRHSVIFSPLDGSTDQPGFPYNFVERPSSSLRFISWVSIMYPILMCVSFLWQLLYWIVYFFCNPVMMHFPSEF